MTSSILVREERVILEVETPRISAGNSHDFQGQFYDYRGEVVTFTSLVIQQVEIDSPSLAISDTVTLDLYRSDARNLIELVSRFEGASQLTDAWKSVFSDRALEYFARKRDNHLYGRVTNDSGNSTASAFHLVITARRVF